MSTDDFGKNYAVSLPGAAGVSGAFAYAGLTSIGVSPKQSILLMLVVPVLMAFGYDMTLVSLVTTNAQALHIIAQSELKLRSKLFGVFFDKFCCSFPNRFLFLYGFGVRRVSRRFWLFWLFFCLTSLSNDVVFLQSTSLEMAGF